MIGAASMALRQLRTIRGFATMTVLTLAWCGLWQDISIANVLSGAALSLLTSAFGIDTGARGSVRPWPLLRLVGVVLVDLVESTINVARETVTPGDGTEEAIIEVQLADDAQRHFLLLLVCVTLTPGTAVVDADPDTGALYLHLLHLDRAKSVAEHVRKLAELADLAIPPATNLLSTTQER